MASLEEENGFSGEEKHAAESTVREEEEKSVSLPEGEGNGEAASAPESEESEQELCFKNGAVRSLDVMFKLWWISLVVLGVFGVFAIIFLVACIIAAVLKSKAMTVLFMLPMGISILFCAGCVTSGSIAAIVLLYRYWKFLPAEEAETTPAKAVGYFFIPLFNLYWSFVAYVKLSRTLDRLLERPKSSCTTVTEIYWVLFLVSSAAAYLVQFLFIFFPDAASSPFLRFTNAFTLPVAALFIAMVCLLQQSLREYLRKVPVSRWKDNPRCSSAPIVLGLLAIVLFSSVMFGAAFVARLSSELEHRAGTPLTCRMKQANTRKKANALKRKKVPAASEAQKEVKAPAAKKAPEAKKEAKAPETKSTAPAGGNAAVRNGTSREAEGKKLD
ncbi:MAG: hypothetical protein J6A21_02430 [Lentisphaeria bacterium]|nr:hypothetical protein [Lentisphaeria bacterium]